MVARRPLVALAAAPEYPDLVEEGPLILAALEEVGVDARTAVWSDPEVEWGAFDLVVSNGTWDNIHHVAAFLSWVDTVAALGNNSIIRLTRPETTVSYLRPACRIESASAAPMCEVTFRFSGGGKTSARAERKSTIWRALDSAARVRVLAVSLTARCPTQRAHSTAPHSWGTLRMVCH